MDDTSRIRHVLSMSDHIVIATSDKQGTPWITPVAFSFDEVNCLYWMSSKDSKHSINIKARDKIAVVVCTEGNSPEALYIEASASELSNKSDITKAIEVLESRKRPSKYKINSVDDVMEDAPWRIYKATPKSMYFRQEVLIGGKSVTRRRKV